MPNHPDANAEGGLHSEPRTLATIRPVPPVRGVTGREATLTPTRPSTPTPGRRIAVLVNPSAGSEAGANPSTRIRAAFANLGVDVHVDEIDPDGLGNRVRALLDAGFDTIVAAGGDGTVSAVARLLVGTKALLGVLPTGTLNHFARDLGVPLDVDAAAGIVVQGTRKAIDIGSVNGIFFVNNASLGLYADQLRMRAKLKGRLWKWIAALVAGFVALRRIRSLWVTIESSGERRRRRCPMIMIGNGEYGIREGVLTGRARLDAGMLALYLFTENRRMALLLAVLRVMMGNASSVRQLESETVPAVTLHVRRRHVPIAIDGEVTKLSSPLRFSTMPGALSVLVPGKSE